MSDWAAVVLVLGLCTLAVVVYGVRRLVSVGNDAIKAESLRASAEMTARNVDTLDKRMARLEHAMRIDGQKLAAEAVRGSLPAFMK